MQIIVATDIHGTHERLRTQLAVLGESIIVSPWSGDGKPFATEHEAILHFHQQDGLAFYERKIAEVARGRPSVLIGFSVGATSVWRYVASPQCSAASVAFLYYGSRIRDHGSLVPRCPTTAFFAENESSFNPANLAKALGQSGAQCTVLSGTHHGFMSPISNHYRADIAEEQIQLLRAKISEHRRRR
jgi:dienelactone hydrolase